MRSRIPHKRLPRFPSLAPQTVSIAVPQVSTAKIFSSSIISRFQQQVSGFIKLHPTTLVASLIPQHLTLLTLSSNERHLPPSKGCQKACKSKSIAANNNSLSHRPSRRMALAWHGRSKHGITTHILLTCNLFFFSTRISQPNSLLWFGLV